MDLHHPITREFPSHLETIKQLKSTNDQFRKAFKEYHRVDDAIYRIEEEDRKSTRLNSSHRL